MMCSLFDGVFITALTSRSPDSSVDLTASLSAQTWTSPRVPCLVTGSCTSATSTRTCSPTASTACWPRSGTCCRATRADPVHTTAALTPRAAAASVSVAPTASAAISPTARSVLPPRCSYCSSAFSQVCSSQR